MKNLIALITFSLSIYSSFGQLNMSYVGGITYDQNLNDIWGYVHTDGIEYALVGVHNGVSIVSLEDPSNPTEVSFVDGISSTWRDIKTWGTYAYVTNEDGNGLMVINLSNLPNSVSAFDWMPTVSTGETLSTCHNIYIDEFGYAYLSGCNVNGGGIVYVDCFSDPGNPQLAGLGYSIYSHDVYVKNNKSYSSEIYAGEFAIYDVTDKSNTLLLGNQGTQAQFTHNTWLSDDGNILYTTDEVGGASVGAYNVSDPQDIIELDQFQPFETLGDGVIPHNVHVWQDWLIISYYTDGCILVDGSNPTNLVEVGNFDTYIPSNSGYAGAWGAYPFLPSGLVLISDIGNGLFVLQPNYVNACWLEGQITDASTGLSITGANVSILSTTTFTESEVDGAYATGYATSGTYDIQVSKPGYFSATVSESLQNGIITLLDIALEPLESMTLTGTVIDAASGNPIPNALIRIKNVDFDFNTTTNSDGIFTLPTFFAGSYDLVAGKWGWISTCSMMSISNLNNNLTLELESGFYDDFSMDFGWTVESTAATGTWERGAPIATFLNSIPANPGSDSEVDCFDEAYVTGNGGGGAGSDDVDDGQTILISPEFPATGDPTVNFLRWFVNYDNSIADDLLEIYVTNDGNEVLLTSVDAAGVLGAWVLESFNLNEFLPSSTPYRIKFVTADNVENGSIVEAGLDVFRVNYVTQPTSVENTKLQSVFIYPNPGSEVLNIQTAGLDQGFVEILDFSGRTVFADNLSGEMNHFVLDLSVGSYLVVVENGNGKIVSRKKWMVK